jgi:peptidoglycan/xylan/chitin deacetylase (PgdA/CDA1 family)
MLRRLLYLFLPLILPLVRLCRRPGYRSVIFHDVIDLGKFRRVIELLEQEFEIVPFGAVCGEAKAGRGKPKIIITFDDGFRSSALAARQVLDPKGLKALFFIPYNFIGLQGAAAKEFAAEHLFEGKVPAARIGDDLQPMTWDDVHKLAAQGHEIGAHTLSHARLSALPDQAARREEIVVSGDKLSAKLGRSVSLFAYPFGDNSSIDAAAGKLIAGRYDYCFTGLRGANAAGSGPAWVYRDEINLDYPWRYILFLLYGGLDPFYARRRKALAELAR